MELYKFCENCDRFNSGTLICENFKYCFNAYNKGKEDIENIPVTVKELDFDPDKYYIIEISCKCKPDIEYIANVIKNYLKENKSAQHLLFVPSPSCIKIVEGEALNTTLKIGLDEQNGTLQVCDKELGKEYSDIVLKALDELLGNICPLGDYRILIMRKFK